MTAYGVKKHQVSGPPILDSERFDITAKIPEGASKEDVAIMLQNLLADRFKLTLHHEKKENADVRPGGRQGTAEACRVGRRRPASGDAPPSPPPSGEFPFKFTMGKDGMPVLPVGRGGGSNMMIINGNARLTAKKRNDGQLAANRLSGQLAKPVNNSTGLNAKYDFVVSWSTEGLLQQWPRRHAGNDPARNAGRIGHRRRRRRRRASEDG